MPTATEHRAAAQSLQRVAERLAEIGPSLDRRRARTGMEGSSRLATMADEALLNANLDVDQASTACAAAITELQRRAAICDNFDQAIRTYNSKYTTWNEAHGQHLADINSDDPVGIRHPGQAPPEPPTPPTYVTATETLTS